MHIVYAGEVDSFRGTRIHTDSRAENINIMIISRSGPG